ncbi:hypothetical protein BS47DRAFT_241891 [Hydnum rufescens UP504]|uniref:DUF6534 domain-containing protein n=1 Tax=Hydnum rufescens UP504 TaxID=1448309 RepID=A0A9P6ALZ7_9AGAM|nr:hypothetical protein BS47DRAFT_241891 [Hydnum rufescens UP504]
MKSLHIYREFPTYLINVAWSSLIVQTFFVYRVYSLSTNLYAAVLVQVLVLLQFGFSSANAIKATMILEFRVIVRECTWLVETWLTVQATVDVVIATYMCLLLRRRRTGFQKTDSVINRMALYTISTGLVTSVLSCISLLLVHFSNFLSFHCDNSNAELIMGGQFAKYGVSLGVLVVGMPLGGFYSITMLAKYVPLISLVIRVT